MIVQILDHLVKIRHAFAPIGRFTAYYITESVVTPADYALNLPQLRPILSRATPDLFPTATLSLGY
jgi:hypothetical protein